MAIEFDYQQSVPTLQTGMALTLTVTLNASAGTVLSVPIPDNVRGVKLNPSAVVYFALGENPEAPATSAAPTLADWNKGNTADASSWTVAYLEPGTSRTLRLVGAAGSESVKLDLF